MRIEYGYYFEPNFNACVVGIIKSSSVHYVSTTGIHNDYLLYITIDEGDQTGGLLNAGVDFPTIPSATLGGYPSWVGLVTPPHRTSNSQCATTNSDSYVYTQPLLS